MNDIAGKREQERLDAERRRENREAEIARLRKREAEFLAQVPQSFLYCADCRTEGGGYRTGLDAKRNTYRLVEECTTCDRSGLVRVKRDA